MDRGLPFSICPGISFCCQTIHFFCIPKSKLGKLQREAHSERRWRKVGLLGWMGGLQYHPFLLGELGARRGELQETICWKCQEVIPSPPIWCALDVKKWKIVYFKMSCAFQLQSGRLTEVLMVYYIWWLKMTFALQSGCCRNNNYAPLLG